MAVAVILTFPYKTLMPLSTVKYINESEGSSNGDKNHVLAKASLGDHRTPFPIHSVHKLTFCAGCTQPSLYTLSCSAFSYPVRSKW